jgi:hypothetical protein
MVENPSEKIPAELRKHGDVLRKTIKDLKKESLKISTKNLMRFMRRFLMKSIALPAGIVVKRPHLCSLKKI